MVTVGTASDAKRKGGIGAKVLVVGFVIALGLAMALYLYINETHRVHVATISDARLAIYTAFGRESSYLGLEVTRRGDRRIVYYPLTHTAYRGINNCTMTIIIAEDTKEVWMNVLDWRVIGYFDVDRNRCITRFGLQPPLNRPVPGYLGEEDRPDIPSIPSDRSVTTITVKVLDNGKRFEVVK